MRTSVLLVIAAAASAFSTQAQPRHASAPLRFEQFPAAPYKGPRHAPDYSGKARHYRAFRTMFREGFAKGPLFAGHYAALGAGCGTNCSFWNIGDLTNGHIYDFPLGGEDNPNLQLDFRADSRLVKAYWDTSTGPDAKCESEDLVWNGTRFSQSAVREQPGQCPRLP